MFKRLIKLFSSREVIEVYRCYVCGMLRTNLEWKAGRINCICGSNRVTPTYPNILGRARIKIRYVIKGY